MHQPQQELIDLSTKTIVTCVGFLENNHDIGKLLEPFGFNRLYQTVTDEGIVAVIYSPDAFRKNPQFSFSQGPVSDWGQITKNEVLSEGILIINYPIKAQLSEKYNKLFDYFISRREIVTQSL